MKLNLFTPEKTLLKEEECQEILAPSVKGYLGLLPQHAPLVSLLRAGVLKYLPKAGGAWRSLALGWGYLEVYPGGVRILAESAETKESLDRSQTEKELKQVLLDLEDLTLEPSKRERLEKQKLLLEGRLEL